MLKIFASSLRKSCKNHIAIHYVCFLFYYLIFVLYLLYILLLIISIFLIYLLLSIYIYTIYKYKKYKYKINIIYWFLFIILLLYMCIISYWGVYCLIFSVVIIWLCVYCLIECERGIKNTCTAQTKMSIDTEPKRLNISHPSKRGPSKPSEKIWYFKMKPSHTQVQVIQFQMRQPPVTRPTIWKVKQVSPLNKILQFIFHNNYILCILLKT